MAKINTLSKIDSWYQKSLGAALFQSELAALATILPKIFGYYIVQIGGPIKNNPILGSSPINNQIIINPIISSTDRLLPVRCELEQLPFLPESIDAMVLFHVLETAVNPQIILEEIYNSLIHGGYLIILGFNPISLWGITKYLNYSKEDIWDIDWIAPSKLKHWLTNVGFTVGDYQTFYFRPPRKDPSKMLFMEGIGEIFWPYGGASYMFIAHKTTAIITPINKLSHSLSDHQKIAEALPKSTSSRVN